MLFRSLLASSCAVVVICELTAAVVGFSARTLAPFVYFFARPSFVRACQVIFSRIPCETSRHFLIPTLRFGVSQTVFVDVDDVHKLCCLRFESVTPSHRVFAEINTVTL